MALKVRIIEITDLETKADRYVDIVFRGLFSLVFYQQSHFNNTLGLIVVVRKFIDSRMLHAMHSFISHTSYQQF